SCRMSSANRHCEERSDEAMQCGASALDCFASLAMTGIGGARMPIISPSVAEQTRRHGPAWAIMRPGGGENFQQGVVMRGLLCACAAVFALGVGTATAADLPVWAPGGTGVVLLPFTWAGPYFGLNIGGQFTNDKTSTTSAGFGFFPGEAQ